MDSTEVRYDPYVQNYKPGERCCTCGGPIEIQLFGEQCATCSRRESLEEEYIRLREGMASAMQFKRSRGEISFLTQELFERATPPELTPPQEVALRLLSCDKNAFIYGRPGTGKSYIARWHLVCVGKLGKSFCEAPGCRVLREGNKGKIWDTITSCRVLLLDDLDKASMSEYVAENLWLLMEERTSSRLQTVITLNASPDDYIRSLSATFGSKIQSAFERLIPVNKIELQWSNIRRSG